MRGSKRVYGRRLCWRRIGWPCTQASFVQVLIPARREDVKAEAGRAGLLAGEECLGVVMFTPERGRGRQDGFAGHGCVHGQDCPLMCWAHLPLGCASGAGWGHWATVAGVGATADAGDWVSIPPLELGRM